MLIVGYIASREGRNAATVDESTLQSFLGNKSSRVQVRFDSAVEEDRFLRDDGEAFAQTGTGDLGDVDAVVEDLAGDDVGEAQQR